MYFLKLQQYQTVERATPAMFRQDMGIKECRSAAPNLKRFVVLSAPVTTLDGTCVNDVLNANVNEALEWTKANMARKGWQPEVHWTKSQAASNTYHDYFDLPRKVHGAK